MVKCDHSDTRLSCVDCSQPVCPGCMVQCAVGQRCPKCTGKFTSHVAKSAKFSLTKTLLFSFASGFGLCCLSMMLSAVMGLLSCFNLVIVGFFGVMLGQKINQTVGLGNARKYMPWVGAACAAGVLVHPVGWAMVFSLMMGDLSIIAAAWLAPVLIVLTVMAPIISDS